MKNHSKIFWGIALLLLALGLLMMAFAPEFDFIRIPIWKLVLGVLIVSWIVDNVFFGKTLGERLDVFLPLALLFVIFKKEIFDLTGGDADKVKSWLVIIAAVVLTVAVHVLFDQIRTVKAEKTEVLSEHKSNRFSGSDCVFDAADAGTHRVSNRFGDMKVSFKNADVVNVTSDVHLDVDNSCGQITVTVPADWEVVSYVDNSLGSVDVRPNRGQGVRRLIVSGQNRFGEVKIV